MYTYDLLHNVLKIGPHYCKNMRQNVTFKKIHSTDTFIIWIPFAAHTTVGFAPRAHAAICPRQEPNLHDCFGMPATKSNQITKRTFKSDLNWSNIGIHCAHVPAADL